MLVLSRYVGESVAIGDDITLTITEIDRGKVRISIVAPEDVRIMRDELLSAEELERVRQASGG